MKKTKKKTKKKVAKKKVAKKKATKKTVVKKKTKKNPSGKPMEVSFYLYVCNNGDGSANTHIFPDAESAEAFAGDDDERFCDGDVNKMTILVDEKGELCRPPNTAFDKDGHLIDDYRLKDYDHHYNDPTDWEVRWRGVKSEK